MVFGILRYGEWRTWPREEQEAVEQMLHAVLPSLGKTSLTLTEFPRSEDGLIELLEKAVVSGRLSKTHLTEIHLPTQMYPDLEATFAHVPIVDSGNADAAIDFLLWATSAEQMKRSAQRGNPPTRKSLFQDPELVAKYPAYPAQLRSLESSRPRPRTPYWNEIENAFGIFLSKANSGELTAEDAMNQANAEIDKIIQRQ